MNASPVLFQLTITQIERRCIFHLTWGQGQRLHAELDEPPMLSRLYRDWQRAYLNFYRSLPAAAPGSGPEAGPPEDALRGQLVSSGAGTATAIDWQADLAEFQQRLQLELHRWLQSPELKAICQEIFKAARVAESTGTSVDLLITCNPLDLARLPWETWEIGADSALASHIRIARAPITIHAEPATVTLNRRRPRMLVILGDDRGLNFQKEKEAVAALRSIAEVEFIGWEPGKSVNQVKDEIQTALVDERGWDALFFAGHSNEKASMGGELSIAPRGYVRMAELKPLLAIAQRNGLQFALFNSCNGLNLAESLIDLGLSQVIIMREPIHNRVAEAFFVRFANALAQHKDVQECLLDACRELKTQNALTYPAADLVPSLFRYPHTDLFRIPKAGWRQWAGLLAPSRREAIALLILLVVCWQLPVQKWLLERRVLAQAVYRDLPFQPSPTDPPSIRLIQIDEASLLNEKRFRPIPRDYLARLVDQVAGAPVIGIDYLLDLPDEDTPRLAQSLTAAARQGSHFILGASREQNTGQWRYHDERLTHPDWSISGSMTTRGTLYAELLWREPFPIAFMLATLHQTCILEQFPNDQPCGGQRLPQTLDDIADHPPRFKPSPLTTFSYGLGQMWLHPIIDYSIPPDWIYSPVSAQDALEMETLLEDASEQTIFIVPNYAAAGIDQENEDNFPAPAAARYWDESSKHVLTGGEYHAYLLYQYLNQRFVVPIPDVWMILLGAAMGKGVMLLLPDSILTHRRWLLALSSGTLLYSLLCLNLYASTLALSLPIVSPAIALWLMVGPRLWASRPSRPG